MKIEECRFLELGQEIPVACSPSVLALDGEHEIEIRGGDNFTVRLAPDGPVVLDVHRAMQTAWKRDFWRLICQRSVFGSTGCNPFLEFSEIDLQKNQPTHVRGPTSVPGTTLFSPCLR